MSTRKPAWEGGRKQSIHWNLRWEISNWSILEHSVFGVSPKLLKRWSVRRGSNPRRPAWEDDSRISRANPFIFNHTQRSILRLSQGFAQVRVIPQRVLLPRF